MNEKDKEAFGEYVSWLSDYYFGNDDRKTHDIKVWTAACQYKDKATLNGSRMKQMNDRIEDLIFEIKGVRNQAEFKLAIAIEAIQFAGMVASDAGLKGAVKDLNDYLEKVRGEV